MCPEIDTYTATIFIFLFIKFILGPGLLVPTALGLSNLSLGMIFTEKGKLLSFR